MKRKLGIFGFTLGLLAILAGSLFSAVPPLYSAKDQLKAAHHETANNAVVICETMDIADNTMPEYPVLIFDGVEARASSACFAKDNIVFSLFRQRVNMLSAVPVHLRTCSLLV